MEQDYFTLYLRSYLQNDFPDLLTRLTAEEQEQFMAARANEAAVVFEQARLAGSDVLQAQEVAIATLINGLFFSTYTVLNELLETEFFSDYQRLTQLGKRQFFLTEICPLLERLVQKHESATGDNQRLCYHLLISQLETLIQTHGV